MYSTLEFFKRHRTKILAGVAIGGTLYSAKKVLETDLVARSLRRLWVTFEEDGIGGEAMANDTEECLTEARRHFLFDVHQQSCDKTLRKLVPEFVAKIRDKLNTDALLEELRSPSQLSAQQKIEIWQKLKVLSISKIISLITLIPLTIVVLKAQKSIICQQMCQMHAKRMNRECQRRSGESFFANGLNFFQSLLSPSDSLSERNRLMANEVEPRKGLTELFNHTTEYFRNDGVDLLIGVLHRITLHIVDTLALTETFGSNDLLFLFERIRVKIKEICAQSFADFIIPNLAESNLPNFGTTEDARYFRLLLQHFVNIINSQNAHELFEKFSGQYLEDVLKLFDSSVSMSSLSSTEQPSIPFAKIVPILCNAFDRLSDTSHGSPFHAMISSVELHQFAIFVSNCTNPYDSAGSVHSLP